MSKYIHLEIPVRFRYVDWSELKPNDSIYYTINSHKQKHAYGPFTVVDNALRRLKNVQGVEINFAVNIRPMVIDND